MGATTSVAFRLERSGAPVYIDEFEAISLNRADGQFEVPRSAQAVLEVEVDGSLTTELAAIALDDDIWLSNPVTGDFEPLPPGIEGLPDADASVGVPAGPVVIPDLGAIVVPDA